jgi:hypothetical protein
MAGGPLRGNALVLGAAKGSISGERLPDLADRAQAFLEARLPEYTRSYECVYEDETEAVFLVETGHWAEIGEEMGLGEREWQALQRTHTEHLKQLGTDLGRRSEFETALDVREPVVIGKGG